MEKKTNRKWIYILLASVLILVAVVILVGSFKVQTSRIKGYVGDIRFVTDGKFEYAETTLNEIPAQSDKAENWIIRSESGKVIVNGSPSENWISSGDIPRKGDLVEYRETRIVSYLGFLPYDRTWSHISLISEAFDPASNSRNPYSIGQVLYPSKEFSKTFERGNLKDVLIVEQGVIVIDKTFNLVRVRLADGTVATYGWNWFGPGRQRPKDRNDEWAIGNPFVVGQTVCAVPDSVRESFPDWGIVIEVNGKFVKILGHDGYINWAHFQECVKELG